MRFAYLLFGAVFTMLACESSPPEDIPDRPTGSSSSSSSSSGMSSTSGAPFQPECLRDEDCFVINDCCQCAGVPAQFPPPECMVGECFAPVCDSHGLFDAKPLCRAGKCVLNADCNQTHALCDSIPPTCAPGMTPFVVNGCWSSCVAVAECQEVTSCNDCLPGQACVGEVSFTTEHHCVDIPPECGGKIDCGCVGKSSCVGNFGFCTQSSETAIACECINC